MKNNISRPPIPTCEPVKSYGPGTTEREEAQIEYQNIRLNRIKLIHRKSTNQAKLNHLKNPILVYLRNVLMRFTGIISMRTNAIWSYKISKKL